jgi:hypothetical protein
MFFGEMVGTGDVLKGDFSPAKGMPGYAVNNDT